MHAETIIRCVEAFLIGLLALVELRIYWVLKSTTSQETRPMVKNLLITAAVVVGVLVVLNKGKNLPGIKQVGDLTR